MDMELKLNYAKISCGQTGGRHGSEESFGLDYSDGKYSEVYDGFC